MIVVSGATVPLDDWMHMFCSVYSCAIINEFQVTSFMGA